MNALKTFKSFSEVDNRPTRSNVLNGAKRLNDLNDLNLSRS